MQNYIETPLWRDAHLHLRQEPYLELLGPISARWCSDVVVMPNTTPAIMFPEDVVKYQKDCRASLGSCNPIMTLYLTPHTTVEHIQLAKAAGCQAVKIYPAEQTTNSHHGFARQLYDQPQPVFDLFKAIEKEGMLALWHGELPGEEIMEQEARFCEFFERMARNFPRLRMVLEHVSSAEGVNLVKSLHESGFPVAATITMHHLWLKNGLTDVMRPKCKPDWVCMPIAKTRRDHLALITAVAHPAFFLGTDSAPHLPEAKYCSDVCAGCFTAPHPEMLLETLEEFNLMRYLVPFVTERMGRFYGLGEPVGKLRFVKERWPVPNKVNGYVPFLAGRNLSWRLI